ncbi:MAG: glycosyltransferase family 4 protein [Candidatus Levybacteria bacterium]|nr:glycosyltransferase family 4 protein [Candidatus Levybacteria bacterium]
MEKKVQKQLKDLNVAIVTHTRTTGLSQFLKDWLLNKTKKLVFIGHPLYPSTESNSLMEIYEKGALKKNYNSPFIFKSGILLYIKDAFLTFYFFLKMGSKIDIAVGVNNLNTAALLLLKKMNFIKKVVYHTVDYAPIRFENKLLNNVYHAIDKWCCYNADILWNSSGRMNEGRIKNGMDKNKIAKTIITPDGSNFDPEKRLGISEIDRKMVVFLGHLRERLGLELLVESFSDVVAFVKDAKLLIIGDGPLLNKLKNMVKELKISKNVEFTGFIERHSDVDNKLRKAAIGIAVFEPDKNSYEYYSDAGKPKVYLAAGLPVVITKVPEIADEIDAKKAGFAIEYDKKELAKAIVTLLKNDKLYEDYRKNAIELSKKYIWNSLFYEAFSQTLKHFKKN